MRVKLNFILICSLISMFSFSQEISKPLIKPSEGKCILYFVRPNFTLSSLGFKMFIDDKYLGKLKQREYLYYECEPGEHVIWATAVNEDFVKASFEANKIYVVRLKPVHDDLLSSDLRLNVLNPLDYDDAKDFSKSINKDNGRKFTEVSVQFEDEYELIVKSMKTYNRLLKKNSDRIEVLSSNMNFLNSNYPEKK
ncbi:DUF2846 domain-containing protein [Flavobacterium amnicola]|uniref:DUF2846 domain-containing protein n=1 Tax=Flavobacterium amnicola TaxID=2506422 RepID=A0A4V1N280_9FLAO|nr:DUF2846 domain-containing protein [Flavobacterium amnicola]RXR20791.1 DUF2846 domain-containing protein [Flavobacterium amnicola]